MKDWWVDGHYIFAVNEQDAWLSAAMLYGFEPEHVRPWTDEDCGRQWGHPAVTSETLYCWKCDSATLWEDHVCTGCGRTWGVPPDAEPEPNVYEVVVEPDGDGWTAALFPVTGGARDSMIETGSGPTPRQALIDLTSTWAKD